jgi:hypothetical protein
MLHNFYELDNGGATPTGSLTLAESTLFGMTSGFGDGGYGMSSIFQIKEDGTGFKVLHSFSGNDGVLLRGL